jgi:conjugal transfer pilus assembly protein TraI
MSAIAKPVGMSGLVRQLMRGLFRPYPIQQHLVRASPPRELLAQGIRPGLLRQIDQLLSVPRSHLQLLIHATILNYGRFVQQLPASEAHHHAGAGGMLDHGLEVVTNALALRRGYLLPQGAEPERLARTQDLWTYAVFTAALLHDVGKVVVDQRVLLFNKRKRPVGTWDPWHGPMDQVTTWYCVEFVRDRRHGLHERVAPLLARFVVPAPGLSWLASDREVLTAWVATISGDRNNAGVLGEIIARADGESVARNLGAGDSIRLPTARATPLHEKLLTALRHLIDEGELPLNRNGAGGWYVNDDLWLVSKRTADALRAHLIREGHDGIPTRNDRLFDVLQEHGLAASNGERAIWRARVAGDGWAHELTMLRVPAARVWPDIERRPERFAGSVTPIESATDTANVEQATPTVRAGQDTTPASDRKVPGRQETKGAQPGNDDANVTETTDSSDAGEQFLAWLKKAVAAREIQVNTVTARVHVVPEGVLLVSPSIFRDFAAKHRQFEWSNVQKRFQKLKLHRKTDGGTNIHRYSVVGSRKRSSINGVLIPDASLVFGASPVPATNPHLVRDA